MYFRPPLVVQLRQHDEVRVSKSYFGLVFVHDLAMRQGTRPILGDVNAARAWAYLYLRAGVQEKGLFRPLFAC